MELYAAVRRSVYGEGWSERGGGAPLRAGPRDGAKGRLDAAYCSDFGMHDEADKRASKSDNVRHRQYIQSMEERIAGLDESRREERLERERRSPPRG